MIRCRSRAERAVASAPGSFVSATAVTWSRYQGGRRQPATVLPLGDTHGASVRQDATCRRMSRSLPGLGCLGYLVEPSSGHVVDVTVDRDVPGNQRMRTDPADIFDDALGVVRDR